jgi:hypothetical protein
MQGSTPWEGDQGREATGEASQAEGREEEGTRAGMGFAGWGGSGLGWGGAGSTERLVDPVCSQDQVLFLEQAAEALKV